MHGLLKLLSALYGAAHRTVPKPSQLQSDSESHAVVAIAEEHVLFHRAGAEALHSKSVRQAAVARVGEGACRTDLHLHHRISIGAVSTVHLRAEVSADGSARDRKRISTVRHRFGAEQPSKVRRVRHHAGHPRLRSARRRMLHPQHLGHETIPSVATERKRRLRHRQHRVHQRRADLRRQLQLNYGSALPSDGEGEAMVREFARQHQGRDSEEFWPNARPRRGLGD